MATRRQKPDELELLLTQTAEAIGTTLGKIAIKTGLAKSPTAAAKKKPARKKTAAKASRHKLAGPTGSRPAKKAPRKTAPRRKKAV